MSFSSAIVLKTLGGLGTAAAAGVGSWWLLFGSDDDKLTKWDRGLINFLSDSSNKDNDIKFSVKTGENADTDLTNNFPNFSSVGEEKLKITISVSTSTEQIKGSKSNDEIKN